MEQLVEIIAKNLVSDPDRVSVRKVTEGERDVIILHTAPEDAGRVIGKGGKLAKAIRILAQAANPDKTREVRVRIDD